MSNLGSWQPIETLFSVEWVGHVLGAHYDTDAGCWSFEIVDWCGDRLFHDGPMPTHWCRLVPPEVTPPGAGK